jgi:hypothetical protein
MLDLIQRESLRESSSVRKLVSCSNMQQANSMRFAGRAQLFQTPAGPSVFLQNKAMIQRRSTRARARVIYASCQSATVRFGARPDYRNQWPGLIERSCSCHRNCGPYRTQRSRSWSSLDCASIARRAELRASLLATLFRRAIKFDHGFNNIHGHIFELLLIIEQNFYFS